MLGFAQKMNRMGAIKLSYGRDVVIYPDTKPTDKGYWKFHCLPTWSKITVTFYDNTSVIMTKAQFEVAANTVKVVGKVVKNNCTDEEWNELFGGISRNNF